MKQPILIPTILAQNAEEAFRDFTALGRAAPWVHLDVLDKTLYPFESWFDPRILRSGNIRTKMELHLMVNDPAAYVDHASRIPNVKRVIWHVEAPMDHAALIKRCRRKHLEVGLAIGPDTILSSLIPFLREVDQVLVMGVVPGKSGQKILPHTLKTLHALHQLVPRLVLGFDGGVTRSNLRSLIHRGASRVYAHSLIFKTKHPDQSLRAFNALLKTL